MEKPVMTNAFRPISPRSRVIASQGPRSIALNREDGERCAGRRAVEPFWAAEVRLEVTESTKNAHNGQSLRAKRGTGRDPVLTLPAAALTERTVVYQELSLSWQARVDARRWCAVRA